LRYKHLQRRDCHRSTRFRFCTCRRSTACRRFSPGWNLSCRASTFIPRLSWQSWTVVCCRIHYILQSPEHATPLLVGLASRPKVSDHTSPASDRFAGWLKGFQQHSLHKSSRKCSVVAETLWLCSLFPGIRTEFVDVSSSYKSFMLRLYNNVWVHEMTALISHKIPLSLGKSKRGDS
jgi:hypothetical protein